MHCVVFLLVKITISIFSLVDSLANQTLNDGQSLLDEMSRPMKNSSGVDITPNYSNQIKHINKSVEDLQERKLRCDELADVRRLKLQQILQLFTCERDADQVGFLYFFGFFLHFSYGILVSLIVIEITLRCLIWKGPKNWRCSNFTQCAIN